MHGVGAGVHIQIKIFFNCLPLYFGTVEVNAGQTSAAAECMIANAGDAIRNGNTGQAVATCKRITAKAGDTTVQRNNAVFAT